VAAVARSESGPGGGAAARAPFQTQKSRHPRHNPLTIVNEGVSAVADLLEEAAPNTCAALLSALPAAGPAHHACYSGSECVFRLPELLKLAPENATSDVVPGDVAFTWFDAGAAYGVTEAFAEICWFYDRDALPSMPEGPVPVSRFARIREGSEPFYAVCRRMRKEGIKPLRVEGLEERGSVRAAGLPARDLPPLTQIRLLADRFVDWQTSYGRPDPARCPFVTLSPAISTHLHSPTYLAFGLYRAYEFTGDPAYKAAADRYVVFYLACLRHPPAEGQRLDVPAYPFQYGMGLAGYGAFKRHNPEEALLDAAADAVFQWLLLFRWDEGSYLRNGYGSPKDGIVDCANSDDNLHSGRGLVAYHRITGRPDVLAEAEGLAGYYLTDVVPGTYRGCWSPALGTWVVAPTVAQGIEHFRGPRSCDMGWGFSNAGTIEYLTQLAAVTAREDLKRGIAEKCATAMRWHFDACQFEDGACGMSGRDDKWLGMTAGAILSFIRTRDAGYLSPGDEARYRPKALLAAGWLLDHVTPETVRTGGYFRVTGQSEPRPPENLAWMLGWTLEAMTRLHEIEKGTE
jgi:hypothetical protein